MVGYLQRVLSVFVLVCSLLLAAAAYAQAPAAVTTVAASTTDAPMPPTVSEVLGGLTPEEMNAPFTGSLFFSPLELAAIRHALSGKVSSAGALELDTKGAPSAIPQRRVISIAGVVYRAPENWIVWMNGKKVTPEKLLPEIVAIDVQDSSKVNLEWYDAVLNKVISITLRPHQTYDIPTGILLPGSQ